MMNGYFFFFFQALNLKNLIIALIYLQYSFGIKQSPKEFSDNHFKHRDKGKNILAISSEQSKEINSYNDFIDVYEQASKKILNTQKRPAHWGGYSFRPYYFEFWQGHNLRINKREAFIFEKDVWKNIFLQP